MKQILWLIVFFFIQLSAMAAPVKTIRFGTEATYPPFEYVNESGQLSGFDIDVAKALCQQMQAVCTFSNQSFNSLIPSLRLGKFDALIAALGITAEREKQVSFTKAYYEPSASFVAPINKHYTLADVATKTIGVQQGSTFEKYLHDKYGSVTMKTYASIQDAFLDLVSGRVDAVIADTPIALIWLKQKNNNQQFTIVEKPIVDPAYFGSGYGIAVRKNDTELQAALNKALEQIKAQGIYKQIAAKYFGNQ